MGCAGGGTGDGAARASADMEAEGAARGRAGRRRRALGRGLPERAGEEEEEGRSWRMGAAAVGVAGVIRSSRPGGEGAAGWGLGRVPAAEGSRLFSVRPRRAVRCGAVR